MDLPAGRQVAWLGCIKVKVFTLMNITLKLQTKSTGDSMGGLKHRPPETSPLQAKRDGAKRLGKATVRRRQGGHEAVEL